MSNDKPCCAADALRRIRQIPVNGIMTGIAMLDESITAVREQNPGNDSRISEALMKKIRVYNDVPPGVTEAYTRAIMEEYKKSIAKNHEQSPDGQVSRNFISTMVQERSGTHAR